MNQLQNINPQPEEQETDLVRLALILWKRAWIIALVTVICCAITLMYSMWFIAPTYRSSFTAYVNNRVENFEGSGSTTTSDLNASIGLTYLYQDIIVSRSVLMDAAEYCGLDYSYGQLRGKVSTNVSEISALITVYVIDEDPVLATELAAAIAKVAPGHVERMRDGSSMRILDEPVQPTGKYAPNNRQYASIGAVIGFVLSVIGVLVMDLMNDRVDDADELERRHKLIVVGIIPDLSIADPQAGYGNGYGKQAKAGESK